MKYLSKYLKPYWLAILALIALTIVQTQSELMLPQFMSDIVDNGIQYQGQTTDYPSALSADSYEKLQYLVSSDEWDIIQESYQKIDVQDPTYLQEYPLLKESAVYKLQDATDLNDIMVKPMIYLGIFNSEQFLTSQNLTLAQVNFLFKNPELLQTTIKAINQQFDFSNEQLISSTSKIFINQEYKKIGIDLAQNQTNYIYKIGLLMIAVTLLAAVAAIFRVLISSITATKLAKNLRQQVFSKIESFSAYEFSKFSLASLITRSTNDIQAIQDTTVMMLRLMILAPIMGLGALFKVFKYGSIVWIIGVIILTIFCIIILAMAFAVPKFKMIQKLVDRLNLVMRERLANKLVVRAFNAEQHEQQRFTKVNHDTYKVNLFVNRIQAVLMPIMMFIFNASTVAIIWVGAQQIDLGLIQIGDMMAFMQYSMQVLIAFMMLTMIFIMIPRALVSAKRINEILTTEISIKDNLEPAPLALEVNSLTLENVCFKYPKAEDCVLKDLSFSCYPQQSIAFIGSTGSGKSTLLNLFPRFFDPTKGEIKLNDLPLASYSLKDLRNTIAYIPQVPTLFKGTIRDNITYGNEQLTDEEIYDILAMAQAKDFVMQQDLKLDALVAQGGANFSGGQKQRLSIARALAKQAKIYLFDDSLSALDFQTAAKLNAQLNQRIKQTNSILFIVAQRVSSIVHCDQIIVLDEGKIVGQGTHHQLMETCTIYQEIAHSQLSKEELAHE